MRNPLVEAAKAIVKALIYRPIGVRMGKESVFRFPWSLGNRKRIKVGSNTRIGANATLQPLAQYRGKAHDGRISIGSNVYIGGRLYIFAIDHVVIGDGCVLSEDVYITDNGHGLDPRAGSIMDQALTSRGPVRLGRNVFVGYGCSIMDGVELGDHCVVGTRSVVTKSFPPYSMIAGTPARLIKVYDPNSAAWIPAPAADN